MKKDVIVVPHDKLPSEVLAELGDRTKNSWIFLHENVIAVLKQSSDKCYNYYGYLKMFWYGTEEIPTTCIFINDDEIGHWKSIMHINNPAISFKEKTKDPDEIFFINMAV